MLGNLNGVLDASFQVVLTLRDTQLQGWHLCDSASEFFLKFCTLDGWLACFILVSALAGICKSQK